MIMREDPIMPLDLQQNRGPIDELDPTFRDVLQELQGNILNGHGRFHAVHFFIRFKEQQISKVKKWISKFARQHVISAWEQVEQAIAYRQHQTDAGVFGQFALSAEGYRALGIADHRIPTGSNPQNRTASPDAPSSSSGLYSDVYKDGMA